MPIFANLFMYEIPSFLHADTAERTVNQTLAMPGRWQRLSRMLTANAAVMATAAEPSTEWVN